MVSLGVLTGGGSSGAKATSADGSVVVGSGDNDGVSPKAFIWEAVNGMRSLQDLLADGLTIVGVGNTPDGSAEAWVASLDCTTA